MMKLKFSFLILFLFLSTTMRAQKEAWLIGAIKDCKTGNYNPEQKSIKIFDGDREVDFINEGFGAFYAKNMETKAYSVQYQNIFGQTVVKNVNLTEGNNFIDFCLDYFVEPDITTFVSSVNKLDTLKISFKGVSATNVNEQNAVFYYKGNELWADFRNESGNFSKKIKPEILKKLIISEKKAIEAAVLKDKSSDYRNVYTFELGSKKKQIINCYLDDWNFYGDFFITIFGELK